MGLLDAVKDQFLDVIEYVDQSNKLIVSKYQRESGNNELKQGSKVIVRESQNAVFLKGGKLADILPPGIYSLTTDNFPVLSSLKAFPYLFVSPVIADVYFGSVRPEFEPHFPEIPESSGTLRPTEFCPPLGTGQKPALTPYLTTIRKLHNRV